MSSLRQAERQILNNDTKSLARYGSTKQSKAYAPFHIVHEFLEFILVPGKWINDHERKYYLIVA